MRTLERVNIRTNVRTYSHTYVRDRPYIPSTTLLCEGITIESFCAYQNHVLKNFAVVMSVVIKRVDCMLYLMDICLNADGALATVIGKKNKN